jgi:hypothetical protein
MDMKDILAQSIGKETIMKQMRELLLVGSLVFLRRFHSPKLTSIGHLPHRQVLYNRSFLHQDVCTLLLSTHIFDQRWLSQSVYGSNGCCVRLVCRNLGPEHSHLPTRQFLLDSHKDWEVPQSQLLVIWDQYCRHYHRSHHSAVASPHGFQASIASENKSWGCRYLRAWRICCHYEYCSYHLHLSIPSEIRYVIPRTISICMAHVWQYPLCNQKGGVTSTWSPQSSVLACQSTNLCGPHSLLQPAGSSADAPFHFALSSFGVPASHRADLISMWDRPRRTMRVRRYAHIKEI